MTFASKSDEFRQGRAMRIAGADKRIKVK